MHLKSPQQISPVHAIRFLPLIAHTDQLEIIELQHTHNSWCSTGCSEGRLAPGKAEQKGEYDTKQLQTPCAAAELHWHGTEGTRQQPGLQKLNLKTQRKRY